MRKRFQRTVVAICMVAGGAVSCAFARPQLKVSVDATSITLGDPLTIVARLIGAEVTTATFQVAADSGDKSATEDWSTWSLLSQGPERTNDAGKPEAAMRIVVAPFQLGAFPPPELSASYVMANGERGTATSDWAGTTITVGQRRTAEDDSLRKIKPPVSVPMPAWLGWATIAAVVLLSAGVAALAMYLQRKKRAALLILTPAQRALQKLADVDKRGLIEAKRYREYYTDIADAVRSYLQEACAIHALEFTSEELLAALEDKVDVPKTATDALKSLLAESDLVKFARHIPTPEACRRALMEAETVVRRVDEEQARRLAEAMAQQAATSKPATGMAQPPDAGEAAA